MGIAEVHESLVEGVRLCSSILIVSSHSSEGRRRTKKRFIPFVCLILAPHSVLAESWCWDSERSVMGL